MTVEEIISKLKEMEVDGETMEFIIESVGMRDQMLRQLVMIADAEDVEELLEEKNSIEFWKEVNTGLGFR
jgi:hypothetical protein